MSDENKGLLSKLIQTVPQALRATKESIQEMKAIRYELVPAEPISKEQIDKFVNPLYQELQCLKKKLHNYEWLDLQTDIKTHVVPLNVPSSIKKLEKRWNKLQSIIDNMADLSAQISGLCLGIVNEIIGKGRVLQYVKLSSDLEKQLANYAFLPTGKNSLKLSLLNEEIKPAIYDDLKKQYSGIRLDVEVNNTVSELSSQIRQALTESMSNSSHSMLLQNIRTELEAVANDLMKEINSDLKKLGAVQQKQSSQKDK